MRINIFNKIGIFLSDGCAEIIGGNNWRILLFWPPAFSLMTKKYDATWNVFTNKFGHKLKVWRKAERK